MKKFVAILLVLVMALSLGLAGCTKDAAPADTGAATGGDSTTGGSTTGGDATTPADTATPADTSPIKIGYLTELSSALAVASAYTDVTIQMWLEDLNNNGGICGRPVELVLLNAQNDTSIAIQRLEEAKAQGCVCTFQCAIAGGHAPAIAKWCGQNKCVVNNNANTATEVTITNHSKYYFNCSSNGWGIGKITAINMIGKMGYDTYCYVGVDEACCRDTELFLERSGQEFNPKCKEINSYTLGWDDPQFAPILTTLMSAQGDARPSFVLEQGGSTFLINLVKQANQYGFFDEFVISNDFVTSCTQTAALVAANEYPYGKIHGYGVLQYWNKDDPGQVEWINRFLEKAKEMTDRDNMWPADGSLTTWYMCLTFQYGLEAAIKAGADINDPDQLAPYVAAVDWTDFSGHHYFRDFDNQLTFDAYFMTSKDGGEEWGHLPIADTSVKYEGDEYLPTFEEMDAYANEIGMAGWYEK